MMQTDSHPAVIDLDPCDLKPLKTSVDVPVASLDAGCRPDSTERMKRTPGNQEKAADRMTAVAAEQR